MKLKLLLATLTKSIDPLNLLVQIKVVLKYMDDTPRKELTSVDNFVEYATQCWSSVGN